VFQDGAFEGDKLSTFHFNVKSARLFLGQMPLIEYSFDVNNASSALHVFKNLPVKFSAGVEDEDEKQPITGPPFNLETFLERKFFIGFDLAKLEPIIVGSSAAQLSLEISFNAPTTSTLALMVYTSRRAAILLDRENFKAGTLNIDA